MKQIFLIDPLEKLCISSDSSMMMALTLKQLKKEVYILFEKDLYINNQRDLRLNLYEFSGEFQADGYRIDNIKLGNKKSLPIRENDTIHMRLDPPFNLKYLRVLWILNYFEKQNIKVTNSSVGILSHNEKLVVLPYKNNAMPSYIGNSWDHFLDFINDLKGYRSVVLKPIDGYQGIGVIKVDLNDHLETIKDTFLNLSSKKSVMAMAFQESVYNGEIRSIFFKGEEIGSLLKIPAPGNFLANIFQGGKYYKAELPQKIKNKCQVMALDLMKEGIDLIAYDILGDYISETNVTCPGLIVEVSLVLNRNLALHIANNL